MPDQTDPSPGEATPPPSYNPLEEHATASTSSSNTPAQPTFKSKPTNYVSLFSENSSVKGEYVIDPYMNIPSYLLPLVSPEESEADRKNLYIHSENGAVNADICLLGAQSESVDRSLFDPKPPAKRTTLDLSSENSSVTAQVKTAQGTPPFLLTISAKKSDVYVTLPRSFNGRLVLTTAKHDSVSLADTLSENCSHLSQADKTRTYFIGDLCMLDDSDWTGDEVRVEAYGKIKVKYVENTGGGKNPVGDLFRWLLFILGTLFPTWLRPI